jgi:surface antigen
MMKILLVLVSALGMVSNIFTKNPDIKVPVSEVVAAVADTLKKDVQTGLIEDENWYMVKAQCTSCHSSKLILQNRFTRDGWKQKIRWMQAKHNLWELGDTEKQVLDYLEKHYAPTASVARRAPLKDIKWYKLEQK